MTVVDVNLWKVIFYFFIYGKILRENREYFPFLFISSESYIALFIHNLILY